MSFNRVAPFYDLLARLIFGKAIRKAQVEYLNRISSNDKVLILGGGTGWILDEIRKHGTPEIIYVDISEKMISRSKKRGYPENKVTFITGSHHEIPEGDYDVILTFFFLDMFNQSDVTRIVHEFREKLKSGGLWLVADFNEEIQRRGNKVKKALLKFMYWFFRLTCNIEANRLAEFRQTFEKQNLKLQETKLFYSRMIFTSCYTN